jgi:isoleucyl-tRNA synthetase
VQQARKDAGLHVSDRIRLALAVPDMWRSAVVRFRDWIAEQTLARSVEFVDAIDDASLSRHESQLGDARIAVGVARFEEGPG